jgi:hypothetical protein
MVDDIGRFVRQVAGDLQGWFVVWRTSALSPAERRRCGDWIRDPPGSKTNLVSRSGDFWAPMIGSQRALAGPILAVSSPQTPVACVMTTSWCAISSIASRVVSGLTPAQRSNGTVTARPRSAASMAVALTQ